MRDGITQGHFLTGLILMPIVLIMNYRLGLLVREIVMSIRNMRLVMIIINATIFSNNRCLVRLILQTLLNVIRLVGGVSLPPIKTVSTVTMLTSPMTPMGHLTLKNVSRSVGMTSTTGHMNVMMEILNLKMGALTAR